MGLSELIKRRFKEALHEGHLFYYPSTLFVHLDPPLQGHIRLVPALAKKDAKAEQTTKTSRVATLANIVEGSKNTETTRNPFLPVDLNLLIEKDYTEHYSLILNKYSVMKNHFMLVTKEFEKQESLLAERDFHALWRVIWDLKQDTTPLAFYNSGKESGASQPHRHIQYLMLDQTREIPFYENLIRMCPLSDTLKLFVQCPDLNFVHYLTPLTKSDTASSIYRAYLAAIQSMPSAIGHEKENGKGEADMDHLMASISYNLVLTREWMLTVPRKQADYGPLAMNALGTVGMFLTKSEEDTQWMKNQKLQHLYSQLCYKCS